MKSVGRERRWEEDFERIGGLISYIQTVNFSQLCISHENVS